MSCQMHNYNQGLSIQITLMLLAYIINDCLIQQAKLLVQWSIKINYIGHSQIIPMVLHNQSFQNNPKYLKIIYKQKMYKHSKTIPQG